MAMVLMISSWVARGHVGLGALTPVLNRRGFETISLPTVVLSNHPGHPRYAGSAVTLPHLNAMFQAIVDNGWLGDIDAILTGYLPSDAHVDFAADVIGRVRELNPQVHVLCDPVLGDLPDGLYIPDAVAEAMQARLLPLATSLTPNAFELSWLTAQPINSVADAVALARSLNAGEIIATSVPAGPGHLATVCVTKTEAFAAIGPELSGVPHGTGDMFAGMYLSARLTHRSPAESLAEAVGGVGAAIGASLGSGELQLAASQDLWAAPAAVEIVSI